jgi:hypothetical protein
MGEINFTFGDTILAAAIKRESLDAEQARLDFEKQSHTEQINLKKQEMSDTAKRYEEQNRIAESHWNQEAQRYKDALALAAENNPHVRLSKIIPKSSPLRGYLDNEFLNQDLPSSVAQGYMKNAMDMLNADVLAGDRDLDREIKKWQVGQMKFADKVKIMQMSQDKDLADLGPLPSDASNTPQSGGALGSSLLASALGSAFGMRINAKEIYEAPIRRQVRENTDVLSYADQVGDVLLKHRQNGVQASEMGMGLAQSLDMSLEAMLSVASPSEFNRIKVVRAKLATAMLPANYLLMKKGQEAYQTAKGKTSGTPPKE